MRKFYVGIVLFILAASVVSPTHAFIGDWFNSKPVVTIEQQVSNAEATTEAAAEALAFAIIAESEIKMKQLKSEGVQAVEAGFDHNKIEDLKRRYEDRESDVNRVKNFGARDLVNLLLQKMFEKESGK